MTVRVNPLRCLIVDDNADFIAAAADVLGRNDITIVGATTNSTEALRCVASLRPDVALIDVDLGGESGFDLAERLHQSGPATAQSVLIMMSAHDGQDFADMLACSPAVGFIPKLSLSAQAIRALLTKG
jgi:DNA-binding NarL/FixJ family response regulator